MAKQYLVNGDFVDRETFVKHREAEAKKIAAAQEKVGNTKPTSAKSEG